MHEGTSTLGLLKLQRLYEGGGFLFLEPTQGFVKFIQLVDGGFNKYQRVPMIKEPLYVEAQQ